MNEVMSFLLSFSHELPILSIGIIGYIWIDRKTFFNALTAILTAVIVSHALKITFQIPLSPMIGVGYAFPSGHTLASTAFYGVIFLQHKNIFLRSIIAILMIGICSSLIYFGYHNAIEIAGGLFFGVLLVLLLNLTSKKELKFQVMSSIIFVTICMYYIFYMGEMNKNVCLGYYALSGINLASLIYKDSNNKFLMKVITSVVLFSTIMLLRFLLIRFDLYTDMPPYLSTIHWLVIGYLIPATPYFISKLRK